MTRAFKLNELRAFSDTELEQLHDAETTNVVAGVSYLLDEVRRRETAAAMRASTELARRAFWLTVASTVLSAVATVVAVVALLV